MFEFLNISDYMPHGMCLLWQPWLLTLHAGSDLLIFAAYCAIPLALLQVLRRRTDLRHRGLVTLFAAFIMLCGLTHLLSIVTLWVPIYPILGVLKLMTGVVSAATAIALFRLVPTLIAIPSPNQMSDLNEQLKQEISAHMATLESLRKSQTQLEAKVEERTAELKEVNAKLAIAAREAVHRSRNLLSVVSSMARQSAKDTTDVSTFVDQFTDRVLALANATAAVMQEKGQSSVDLGHLARKQLEPMILTYGDRITIEGPAIEIGSEAAQQFGLALHELGTNTLKFGALATDAGTVRLSWDLEVDAAQEAQLVLSWEESNAVPVADAAVPSGGFGTRLLTKIIPLVLHGQASRSFEGLAMTYNLRVPLSALGAGRDHSAAEEVSVKIIEQEFGLA